MDGCVWGLGRAFCHSTAVIEEAEEQPDKIPSTEVYSRRQVKVLGLLVWALIADTPYHLYPAYGWVMFVAVFLWLLTIVFFIIYLFQLHMKLYMVPWPLVLMVFFVAATVLYITAFITCASAVDLTSLKGSRPYNQRSAASFFACLVMIAYGVSAFFSFQAWRGVGSNAATSQMAGGYS
ncbi:Plasmolipin [Microtus ochrogaster]|uniref:Plasmolipin n=1 Tax=Microtus ochrogaster TaxID=79684 RepID=A0A8J6KKN4_MICOH|nr:Plasmolipin [Microtus ochrogaster]